MIKKVKAVAGNNGSASTEYLKNNNLKLSDFDYAENYDKLQSFLAVHLQRHKKVVRLYKCFCCERSFTAQKMSNCLAVCRECYESAQDKGAIAKKNFVEKTLNNFHKFLRRRVLV